MRIVPRPEIIAAVVGLVCSSAASNAQVAASAPPSQPPAARYRIGIVPPTHGDGKTLTILGAESSGRAEDLARLVRPGPRAMTSSDVDVAYGLDFQLLEWLRTDCLDAISLSIGTALFDARLAHALATAAVDGPELASLAQFVVLRCSAAGSGGRPAQLQAFRRFVDQVWEDAAAEAAARESAVLWVPSATSLRGFVVPVLFAEESLALAHPEYQTDEPRRNRFWSLFCGHVRFMPAEYRLDVASMPSEGEWITFGRDGASASDLGEDGFSFESSALAATALCALVARGDKLPHRIEFVDLSDRDRAFVRRIARALAPHAAKEPPSFSISWLRHAMATDNGVAQRQKLSPDEALLLVRHDQACSKSEDLALVLPGGGVKAAYQSAALDWLYDIGKREAPRLWNKGAKSPGKGASPLSVRWIVGNSGGALLGMFVSLLDLEVPARGTTLVDALWRERADAAVASASPAATRRFIDSDRVLPHIDMLRWGSLVVACIVATLILAVVRSWVGYRSSDPLTSGVAKARRWRFRAAIGWVSMLALLPICLKVVGGSEAAEHVPVVQGFAFFACIALAVYRDQAGATTNSVVPITVGVLAGLVGASALGLLVAQRLAPGLASADWWPRLLAQTLHVGDVSITGPSLVASVAGVVVFLGYHLALSFGREVQQPPVGRKTSYALLLTTPFASWLVLYLAHTQLGLRCLPLLELAPEFFVRWIGLSAGVVLLTVFIAGKTSKGRDGLRLLLSNDAGRWMVMPRHVRMTAYFSMAWLWWNAVMAPALYGNAAARQYVDQCINGFAEHPVSMTAGLVAPAVSLKSQSVRYFEIDPLESAVADRPRGWVRLQTPMEFAKSRESSTDAKHPLREVIIASGSPYPVFPPHRVDYAEAVKRDASGADPVGLPGPELLVDGGYAHNVPVSVARELGARQIVIVDNVPSDVDRTDDGEDLPVLGTLFRDLPRLFPFLYSRAQAGDYERNSDLFIVRLWPERRPDGSWYFLGDFRRETVEELARQGRDDYELGRRIATIEDCGRPVYRRAEW